ncbi:MULTISPECIES: sporulation integral membrane protein YtvI [Virgibacillus]|uniref:Sporulation integral membrane protein YtvI n=1 Tax=Virgibacillus massiliensis TaxID=1462526 RepID=A0A024QF46_9BACI|nr:MULTISPECIES: sporulation integral membrane protein YtvI [Virgibacillus]CDQ40566.1 sporulation integral membrane protein YtvI [Virgibacillus massiliensis]
MTRDHAMIILRFTIVLLSILSLSWVATWIFKVSYPFWIAALLVWMFYPLVRLIRSKVRVPNGLAVFVVLLISLAVLFGAITGIVFLIIFGVRRISEVLPQWIQTTSTQAQHFFNDSIFPLWQKIGNAMDVFTPKQQAQLQDSIASLGNRLAASLTQIGSSIVDGLTQLFIIVPSFLLAILFIFIAFYFIGKDWERIFYRAHQSIPTSIMEKATSFWNILKHRVFGFIRAQIILMFIASFIVFIGLLIIKAEHALTIAIIVGIAEIIPYLGSGTILIPWAVYMLFTGDIGMGIGLGLLYGITAAVRQIIEPKILSTSLNLHALAILISLFVGLQIFGGVGIFLGPLILIIGVIFKDIGVLNDLGNFIKNGFKEE